MDFASAEPLDDLHRSSTLGTAIKIRSVFGGGGVLFSLRFWGSAQQVKAKRQEGSAFAVG